MPKIKYKKTLNLILIFSIFSLITAYFIQYVLSHQPCNLCLFERIPYVFVIIVTSLCLYLKKFEKNFLIILSLIFFVAALLSFYHFGIEQGFFKESLVCNLGSQEKVFTTEELLRELREKPISCRNVTFRILGFSLATINTLVSLILSIITLNTYLNYEKKK
jgi:disulfide bond formation protein DsbB